MTITLKGIPHRLVAFLTLFPLYLTPSNRPMSSLSLLSISCSCDFPSPSVFLLYMSCLVLPFPKHSLSLSFRSYHSRLSCLASFSNLFSRSLAPTPLSPFTLSLSLSLCVYVCIYMPASVCICVVLSCKRVKSRFACCIELLVGSV